MRRIPKFVLLRAFEAAARLQSFSAAARELHLTPSAISHQVRELEEVFGRALFLRRNRRVELTGEGRRLLKGLTRALDQLEACCAEVNLEPSGQLLSVYCAPTFAAKWLGPRLPAFMEQNPGIRIRITSGAEAIDLIQLREIDVAITYLHAHRQPGVDVMTLGRERIAPLCSPELLNDKLSWREQIERLTLIESQLCPVTWRDWFRLNNMEIPERPRQSFDRAALSISTAVDGMGAALESTRLAERELARGDLVQIGPSVFKSVERDVHFLSTRSNEQHVDKIKRFRHWLLANLKPAGKTAKASARVPSGTGS